MRCYWEYLKENFGNRLGTHCEHTENKKSPKPKEKTKAPMNLDALPSHGGETPSEGLTKSSCGIETW